MIFETLDFIIKYGYYYVAGLFIFFILFNLFWTKKLKLTPELVPYKMHYKNVRAVLSENDWRTLAKTIYKESSYKCDICGARERLECHEVWKFNDRKLVQSLIGLTTLCSDCHRVKHIGLARKMGYFEDTLEHMCKVNQVSRRYAKKVIEWNEKEVAKRNKDYSLDLRFLNKYRHILPRQYSSNEIENCKVINDNY